MREKTRVAVLMGGRSAERSVSLSTGRQIVQSLNREKFVVHALDVAPDLGLSDPFGALDRDKYVVQALDAASGLALASSMELQPLVSTTGARITALTELGGVAHASAPDVVIIALHGPGGEDGTVQGMLDLIGIPYTGSGVLASALAMDKRMCKRVLTSVGIRMPRDVTVTMADRQRTWNLDALGAAPWIVKPNAQGSTIGMSVVQDAADLSAAFDAAFQYDDTLLIEEFVSGTEITVPILGNADLEVLPIVEIVPAGGFYDYAAKYTPGATDEIVPARLAPHIADQAREIARTCHRTLGCRGMSRTDMIVSEDGEVYTLEVNTIPGMTPTSLLPRAADAAGIAFPQLLERLIALALHGKTQ